MRVWKFMTLFCETTDICYRLSLIEVVHSAVQVKVQVARLRSVLEEGE